MKATKNAHDWSCEAHGTYGWRGESCRQCPEAPSEIAELKRQLNEWRNQAHQLLSNYEHSEKQLAESQAREARLLKFIGEVAKQTPEKPDYWSSCSQCERNSSEAEDYMELPHDDTALKEYRDAVIEECAKVCDAQANEPECPERAKYCAGAIRKLKGAA